MNKKIIKFQEIISYSYQVEHYAVLKFYQTWRFWALSLMFISLALATLVFEYDFWVLACLLLFYIFLVVLVTLGYSWPWLVIMVSWLVEKYNNDGYLLIKFWSVPIFLVLGIALFYLCCGSFKIQLAREINHNFLPKQHRWQLVFLAVIFLFSFWYVLFYLRYYHSPSVNIDFKILNQAEQTVLGNELFDINLKISSQCHLDVDQLNYRDTADLWSGKLWCQGYDDYVDLSVSNSFVFDTSNLQVVGKNAWLFDKANKFWTIDVYDNTQKYRLLIGGYASTNPLKEQILNSFKD